MSSRILLNCLIINWLSHITTALNGRYSGLSSDTNTHVGSLLGKKADITGFFSKSDSPGIDSSDHSFKLIANYNWNGWRIRTLDEI